MTDDYIAKLWITRDSPLLVAQINFQEFTPDGHLRHSSFAGLRNDKEALEVGRE